MNSAKLEQFRKERENYQNPVSLPICREASKLEATEDRRIKGYPIVWGSKNDFEQEPLTSTSSKSFLLPHTIG